MFKKSKKKEEKEEKNSVVDKMGGLAIGSIQRSSERRVSENFVEQRSVTYSTTSYNSVRVTKTEQGKSTVTSRPPLFNKSVSLLDNQPNKLFQPLTNNKIFAIDAKPFNTTPSSTLSGASGYQSPFSRKLSPLAQPSTDAKPFNANLQTPPRKTSVPYTPIYNQPRFSSYLPQTTPSPLAAASSTQSLPSSSEASERDPRIPTYDIKGKLKGKMLIINNIKFMKDKQERKGAEIDEKNMRALFKDIGFTVEAFRDLKKSDMMSKINKFAGDSSLKKSDISIVTLMSHGSNIDDKGKTIGGGFTQIYGIDDVGLPIDDILNRFSAENCPAMSGKPKIFIFQCCRGENEEKTLHIDAAPMKNIVKKHADMLIAFSTLPGFYSIRDTLQGSWYIQGICDVFKRHAKEFDVETLLKIVDDQLSKKHPNYQQTSMYESRGFKRCFLYPKK